MRCSFLWPLLTGACFVLAETHPRPRPRNHDLYDYYAIHLDPSTSPIDLAAHLGLEHDGPLSVLDHHHILRGPKKDNNVVREAKEDLKRRRKAKRDAEPHILDAVRFNQKQVPRKRLVKRYAINSSRDLQSDAAISQRAAVAKKLSIQDPIFDEQWHIFNTQNVGHDLNVTDVWLQGITGKGATVCIIDDGLDMDSGDLKDNYFAEGSYDFNDHVDEPRPRLSDDQHGTRCAGEVAAGRNNVCGVGMAYDAKVSGIRILSAPLTDADEAEAVIYGFQHNDIYSCSWGPPDDGATMDGPGVLIEKAYTKAVQQGRGGKGTIYVFAAGNGALNDDNCNFDGYTNSIYSITIGAIDRTDSHPYYSEACSAQIAVTYSSGSGEAIHTTDVGANKCTGSHGGTSAAGPIASGAYALVLSVRPDLTWRDMQWLQVLTAVPFFNQIPEDQWQKTALGRQYHHQFGYGKIDTWALVEKAKDWKLAKPQAWFFSPWIHVDHAVPEGKDGLVSTLSITKKDLEDANLETVEHVTVTMNVEHTRRGDLSVDLISPEGLVSQLSVSRKNDEVSVGYVDWTFMSVVHWGEKGVGNWTVIVRDNIANDHQGTFTHWRIKLFGESINGENQPLLPMPDEHDDDDDDRITAHLSTTSLPSVTATAITSTAPVETDHPTRPSIAKPSGSSTSSSGGVHFTGFPGAPTPTASSAASSEHESFLPSPFPTFGVSKKTQVWIYGAVALILAFVAAIGAYMCVQRQRRLRNSSRDNYEFEMIDDQDDEAEGMLANGEREGLGGNKRRRAGELYDAFAGESDEDFGIGEDDDGEGGSYRDEVDSEGELNEKR